MNYCLPAQLAEDRFARSEETVEEQIVTTVSLYPNVRRIDFRTQVENRARDHRLRVEFFAPLVTACAHADQAFDVVTRSLDVPTNTDDWIEQPRPEAPMQNFVSVSDGKIGMTLAVRGIMEYEGKKGTEGTSLALTLLRCTGWLSRNDLTTRHNHAGPALETPGAQEIGTHKFDYALAPHPGDWHNPFSQAFAFAAPMRAVTTDAHLGTLASTASFIEVSPNEFVISAIKPGEDGNGIIMRGYNIGEEMIEVTLRVWCDFARTWRVNLNEEELAPVKSIDRREVRLHVRAREIVTLRFDKLGG
jgi:alpha-mannosidase